MFLGTWRVHFNIFFCPDSTNLSYFLTPISVGVEIFFKDILGSFLLFFDRTDIVWKGEKDEEWHRVKGRGLESNPQLLSKEHGLCIWGICSTTWDSRHPQSMSSVWLFNLITDENTSFTVSVVVFTWTSSACCCSFFYSAHHLTSLPVL